MTKFDVLVFDGPTSQAAEHSGVALEITAPTGAMLIIGPLCVMTVRSAFATADGPIARVDYCGISAERLRELNPSCIVSALMGAAYDGLELASCLQRMGYTGKYRAVSQALPNASGIVSEINEIAPDVDFDVVIV